MNDSVYLKGETSMKTMMRKAIALFMAVLMVMGMFPIYQAQEVDAAGGTTVYFKPNSNWTQSNARFAVYYWTGNTNAWVSMKEVYPGVYWAEIPSCENFKFVRLNGSTTANNWDNKWNEWSNMAISVISGTKNCYTQSSGWDNGSGSWGTFSPVLYVAGTTALTGYDWDATKNQMTVVSPGVYRITFTNVAAGSHEFKVTTANWGSSWGNGSGNYTLTTTGTNDVTITFTYSTKKIETQVVSSVKTYSVKFNGTHVTSNGASSATSDKAYSATLTAATGYKLPDAIDVKVGGTSITGYTYDSATGALSIPVDKIKGDIVITASGVGQSYDVAFSLTNVTIVSGANQCNYGANYQATLAAEVGYILPTTIKVLVGGTELSASSYTYKDGVVTIPGDSLTGNVEIIASTTEKAKYDVTYTLIGVTNENGAAICTHGTTFTAALKMAYGYTTPVAVEVVVGGKILEDGLDYTYDSSSGVLEIRGEAVTGDIVIKATGTAATYDVSFNLTNLEQTAGGSSCTYNTAYTATLAAVSGYELPATIQVSVGGQALAEGYQYDSATGKVTVDAAYVTGTIEITAVAETQKSNVYITASKVTAYGASKTPFGADYTLTLTADSGSMLPEAIKVTIGDKILVDGRDYTYSRATGKVVVKGEHVTDDIYFTVEAVRYIFFNPGNDMWDKDGAVLEMHYWATGATGTTVVLKDKDAEGLYYVAIPAKMTNVVFIRRNPADGFEWNKTADLTIPNQTMVTYTITAWGDPCPCSSATYTGSYNPIVPEDTRENFYVSADVVDYLNDHRVNFGEVNGYSKDNQGIWMNTSYNSVYSYLNRVISANAADEDGYTYPLYFGDLLNVSNRYGAVYQAFTNADDYKAYRDANKTTLNHFNTGANVALEYNGSYSAVVQGLVGNKLNEHGQLVDPVNGKQLFYFDKTSVESWTTSYEGGQRLMAYYSNLQFPFKASYDPDTRVTSYSYDSAKDQSVYIDYEKYDANATSNPMYSSDIYAKDQNGHKGFFPLSQPGDSSNDSNYAFGVKFTIDFTVSKNGTIVSTDGTETPVHFSFTGDDDVWVFIDGYLVLDMGGAHAKASGSIDFQALSATVKQAAQVSDVYLAYDMTQDVALRENLTVTDDLTTAFPAELASKFQNEYDTGVSQVHTLTMFYMERCGIESNMSIEFSMSPIPTGLTVSKDIDNVNPGLNDEVQDDDEFSFIIEATDNEGNEVIFDGYNLTDHGNITIDGVISIDKNGNLVISGIRGDRYAHGFTIGSLDAFTAGTQFIITEGDYDTTKYTGTRWVVYEYSNGYTKVAEGEGLSAVFEMLENSSGNYALNFVNSMKVGTLTLSKEYIDNRVDASDLEFVFQILLDVDGEGYGLHPGLTYDLYEGDVLVNANLVSADGKITLKDGQTATINGIPVGTKYKIVEEDNSPVWEAVGSSEITGTMTIDGAEVAFKNKTTTNGLDKYIHVETGRDTSYTISGDAGVVILSSVTSNSANLNVDIVDGKAVVNGAVANQVYTFDYEGNFSSNGAYVSGTVTVYTYAATIKNYVFDFGLPADLEDPTYNNGLFQGAIFDNRYTPGEVATLIGLSGMDNTQTTITAALNGTFDANNRYGKVIFTPVAFMSQVETYTYKVQITAYGKTFDPNNPETGCILTGTIRVMPASSVYYEDNFNVENGDAANQTIIFFDKVETAKENPTLSQSNGLGNYGYDIAYNGGYKDSNGSSTELEHLEYGYFTFTGTGFDLISQTNSASAGLAVYVFEGGHTDAKLEFVTDLTNNDVVPEDMVFVNTYYADGSLYQIPVVSVRLDAYKTYTVYIQAMFTSTGDRVVIDGLRIYNPLQDTKYYLEAEKNASVNELRVLLNSSRGDGSGTQVNDSNDIVQLAGMANGNLFVGMGKASVVAQALSGNPNLKDSILTASDLESIYKYGPNNEMYLAKNLGLMYTYSVTSENWTMQLGAKAVTADGTAKSISIYVRAVGESDYTQVAEITLSSATDMYYDLTGYLANYATDGQSYELFVISNSEATNNEFVSLTTVKCAGVTLGA